VLRRLEPCGDSWEINMAHEKKTAARAPDRSYSALVLKSS
jgi:hypothetical protein